MNDYGLYVDIQRGPDVEVGIEVAGLDDMGGRIDQLRFVRLPHVGQPTVYAQLTQEEGENEQPRGKKKIGRAQPVRDMGQTKSSRSLAGGTSGLHSRSFVRRNL